MGSSSKRMSLRTKYKIRRKVREHNRKVRKETKSSSTSSRKRSQSDPGIPNSWPYKQQLMEQVEEQRLQAEQDAARRKQEKREARRANKAMSLEELSQRAQTESTAFERKEKQQLEEGEKDVGIARELSRRAYMKEFNKVAESADVILEVLDARDPMGCRCLEAERRIMAVAGGSRKRIVLVLNKVDLVPKDAVEKWLSYLRHEYPTVAFRASLQDQTSALGQSDAPAVNASQLTTKECLGAESLLQLLKNYCRNQNLKTSIAVGVIGFPNVGKSSLINSLKRSRAVNVGSVPGLTKTTQEVHLDKMIRLIDSPGIVFSAKDEDNLVLRNCIKIEQLEDPMSPVETILSRCGEEPLMQAYSLPHFSGLSELLALIAKRRGKLKRGGSFDGKAAARIVLQDWNSGRIPFYTLPPEGRAERAVSTKIVESWRAELNFDDVVSREREVLSRSLLSDTAVDVGFTQMDASNPVQDGAMEDDGDADEPDANMEKKEKDAPIYKVAPLDSNRKKQPRRPSTVKDSMEEDGDFDFAVFEEDYEEDDDDGDDEDDEMDAAQ